MARSTLTPQAVTPAGLLPVYGAADALGSLFANAGDIVLHVKNAGGSSINVTVTTGGTLEGEAVADKVIAVPNGSERMIGRFHPAVYNQPDGTVFVDYSVVTSVTVALLKV